MDAYLDGDMGHIETTRLVDLCREAIIVDAEEIEHLRNCEECEHLLRLFARQFRLIRRMLKDYDGDRREPPLAA